MDNSEARKNLCHPDPKITEQAFTHLLPVIREIASACANSHGFSLDDRKDLISNTSLRFWNRRCHFKDEGEAAFHVYIRKMADWICLDEIKKRKKQAEMVPLDDLELPSSEHDLVLTVDCLNQVGRLISCIDSVLLGLDQNLLPETHTRKLLAAQFFYLHKRSYREILRLLPSTPAEEIPLTLSNLENWLSDSGVLRHLVYQHLWENVYCQGLRIDFSGVAPVVLRELIANFKSFDRAHTIDFEAIFCADGLWQRLVFQLWYLAKWSVPDIGRHIGPLANGVGYTKITSTNLNSWLSGNRLSRKCLKYIEETWGGDLP